MGSIVAELAEKLSSSAGSMVVDGTITLKEQADAETDTAAYGQIWVNTATPNELYFTTDAGDDIALTSGTSIVSGFNADAAQVFNDSGADVDFRIESDNNANMFFVDGGNDRIGIGTSAPASLLDVQGTVQVGGIPDAIAGITAALQIEGTSAAAASMSIFRNDNGNNGPYFIMGKSRGGAVGGDTIVADNDPVGTIIFAAADGVDRVSYVATIGALIGGTPGANDTPGELFFSTTADGAQSVTERMRIDSAGAFSWYSAGAAASMGKAWQKSEHTQGVTNSAVTIMSTATFFTYGLYAVIAGRNNSATTERFVDVITAGLNGSINVLHSTTARGSPKSRSYSLSSENLQVTMGGAGAYNITVACWDFIH